VDGHPMNFHGELQWVQLKCFGMDEMASGVCKVNEIESSSGWRVSHCQGMKMYVVFDPGG
jgi:hypothetical protein